ncbi:hypothetical protein M409DRAFT_19343 [Zasmidium cellare ATCC 36951]|uniref:AMP-dependent synthetase/ligase domain-containing protein n=1 Tax=Zasmidium cellare ATCC 36951 TaxID=1080233 RepID=A0A6A6CUY6_ZASCE|nr:uncharacterized protein M409DRAFT_19343 [Zasmidium cellare ATCC 36951]KAF2170523.1 hypothetical protein M409DRAFT_19343 [Zasmidium cellare ATCC 36951]
MEDIPVEKRLLPAAIDYRAERTPERIWGYHARSDVDVTQGFASVTYKDLAKAVDATAWWLDETLGPAKEGFPTIAYIGLEDLRYVFLIHACIKTKRKVLIPFPANTEEGLIKLLEAAKCEKVLAPKEASHAWDKALKFMPSLSLVEMPPLASFLHDKEVQHYPFTRTLQDGIDDEALVIQTSGTTGNPQPILQSNRTFETTREMVETSRNSPANMRIGTFRDLQDHLSPVFIPLSWAAAFVTTALWPLYTGNVPILLPAKWKQPCTPEQVYESLPYLPKSKSSSVFFIPDLLREYIRKPERLESLKQFDVINFGGAGLDRATGDTVREKTGARVQSAMGSTDSGIYPLLWDEEPKAPWWMYRMHPDCQGFHFQHYLDDLYELCITKQPNDNRHCFLVDPERTVFHTKDLFKTYPEYKDYWSHAGRVDDYIKLDSMTKINVTQVEQTLNSHPDITASLVGGHEKPRAFAIVQLTPDFYQKGLSREQVLEENWPIFEEANKTLYHDAHLTKEMTLIAKAERPLKRTAKNTLDRRSTIRMYEREIDGLYAALRK